MTFGWSAMYWSTASLTKRLARIEVVEVVEVELDLVLGDRAPAPERSGQDGRRRGQRARASVSRHPFSSS